MKKVNFNRSQAMHKRLSEKDRGSLIYDGPYDKKVKSIYHNNVYHQQDLEKRVLSRKEKRDLFKFSQKIAKE